LKGVLQVKYHDGSMGNTYKMGIDIGSTTVKVVLVDQEMEMVFCCYRRHFSEIKKTVMTIIKEAKEELGEASFSVMIPGKKH